MRVCIIGGGPAGMMTAIEAKKSGIDEVWIYERNKELGKKLNITGKGRCNITYKGDNEFFLQHVVTNSKFLYSSINMFNNLSLISYIEELGLNVKYERGNRVFLACEDAKMLTQALKSKALSIGVKIQYDALVDEICIHDNAVAGIITKNGTISFDKIIVATGGMSYPGTGSTGIGYKIAKQAGHTIITPKPALVGVQVYNKDMCNNIEGVTLKNTKLTVMVGRDNIFSDFGELVFTGNGVSGPIVISASSVITKLENCNNLFKEKNVKIVIDMKPALSEKQLYDRITRDFEKYINKDLKNALHDLTIASMIPVILKLAGLPEEKKVNSVTKQEKMELVNIFKRLTFEVEKLGDISTGIITSGGVKTSEINPKTMESKLIKNLYFVGEVIDADAYTGGFNLQIAFSTGFLCGSNINKMMN